MKKFFFFALVFSCTIGLYAAPLDRSVREINDIVNSPELRRCIPPAETILDIKRIERGYILSTNHFQIMVEVLYPLRGAKEGAESSPSNLRFSQPTQTSTIEEPLEQS